MSTERWEPLPGSMLVVSAVGSFVTYADYLKAEARIRELEAEREQFMALPTKADVFLAHRAGAEAALRWAWGVTDHNWSERDFIASGLRAVCGENEP